MGFAGLHRLLVPFLGGLPGLPGPQRQALGSAFGLAAGPAPDRFLVGLAALTLLTDAAAARPVLCLVDDAQWLDQVSVEMLGFVARRLYADRVGMLFTVREGEGQAGALAGLPELVLGGLPEEAASELVAASAGAPVDGRVSARIVSEVAGNPLALMELAAELTPDELSGTVPLGWPLRFGGRPEELYLARVRALPAGTQTLLLVAAADPTGDPALVFKAAGQLGTGPEAGEAAGTDRLVAWEGGGLGTARDLRAAAGAGRRDEFQAAGAGWLRGRAAFASGLGSEAPPLLLKAVKRLEPLNLDLARETYVDAWQAAFFAGHLAGAGDLLAVSRAARALPTPAHPPRLVDLVLDGFALLVIDGPAAATPVLRQATAACAGPAIPQDEVLRWGFVATVADEALWDDEGRRVTIRQVQLARDVGALDQLSFLLNRMAIETVWSGDFAAATVLIAEAGAVCEATGSRFAPVAAAMLAAFRGREAEAVPLIQSVIEQAIPGGQGVSVTVAYWVAAVLYNSLGRYEEALASARQASKHMHVYVSVWAVPELIEAAVRTGNPRIAADALDLLAATTRAGETHIGLGIEARSRALASQGEAAEGYYREAIDRLSRTRPHPDFARAHLVYAEWLRRQRRRRDARDQLRTASEMFDAIGMEAFAARAWAELRSTAERARRRSPGAPEVLTPQEEQVARLAAEHLTNREIAAQLFISAGTVDYHLSKIFRKLGVSRRTQLAGKLAGALPRARIRKSA